MDATLDCTARCCPKEPAARSRRGVAEKIVQFDTLDSPWTSTPSDRRPLGCTGEDVALLGPPGADFDRAQFVAEQPVAQFLETPEGLDFLHRLFTAAHLVFVEANDCGLRNLSWFLDLSGLDEFIAPSYGAQQAVAEELESLLVCFGMEEDQRLAESMPPARLRSARMKPFIRKSAWWPSNRCRTSSSSNNTNRNAMRPPGSGVPAGSLPRCRSPSAR